MGYCCEGKLEIQSEDLWVFLKDYLPDDHGNYVFGVPKYNRNTDCLDVTFAASSDTDPDSWTETPAALKEWEPKEEPLISSLSQEERKLIFFGLNQLKIYTTNDRAEREEERREKVEAINNLIQKLSSHRGESK